MAPSFSSTEHCFSTEFVVASTQFLASLSDEDRELIEGVMDESVEKEFDFWAEMVADSIEQAEALGIEFIDDVDKDAFAESFTDFQQSIANENDMTKSVYDAIVSLRSEGTNHE